MPNDLIEFHVPQQRLVFGLPREDMIKFFRQEIQFFEEKRELLSEAFIVEGRNYGSLNLDRASRSKLQEVIAGLERGDMAPFKEYLLAARELRVLVGQGVIGGRVTAALARGATIEARWTTWIFSFSWIENPGAVEYLSRFRAAMMSPANIEGVDLISAKESLEAASEAKGRIGEAVERLDAYITEKSDSFDKLAERYRERLLIEEPAKFWQEVAARKNTGWKICLLIFGLLAVLPIGTIAYHWSTVAKTVSEITTAPAGGVSLTGLALITIPALFYAWVLKNISRLFVQNLSTSEDAAHRRALAITYLGLADNPKVQLSDTDRALILNALFRPASPQSADDGPPAGILELIKGK